MTGRVVEGQGEAWPQQLPDPSFAVMAFCCRSRYLPLAPQVYLYDDPYTLCELVGRSGESLKGNACTTCCSSQIAHECGAADLHIDDSEVPFDQEIV